MLRLTARAAALLAVALSMSAGQARAGQLTVSAPISLPGFGGASA